MSKFIKSIEDIKNVVYINLDSRTDRKTHIEEQLTIIGFSKFERFKAIQTTDGAIGCSMSHLRCLENARDKGLTHLLICEDDTTFLNPNVFRYQFNTFLSKHTVNEWDVVLLAGNNVLPFEIIDDTCIKVTHCQTTTCYLVNGNYFTTLIDNIKAGIFKLIREPSNMFLYAIDKYWLHLQKKDRWFLIIPLTVVQKEGFSDILKKNVNYIGLMTNVNKALVQSPIAENIKFNIKNIINNK
jgi:GR25 family glycosyltransferase involved in LPS biosynthesis